VKEETIAVLLISTNEITPSRKERKRKNAPHFSEGFFFLAIFAVISARVT